MSAMGKAKISLVNPKNMETYLIDFTIEEVYIQFCSILSITEDTLSFDAEKPKLTRDTVMSEYPDVFGEELGRIESTPGNRPKCCSHSYVATLCTYYA